ncbi:hypothetical protein [Streptomyces sp. NPDC002855]|uniref:hypothetical protein n=1 Tax=Streptomyces sp. NPDC002855 TaxID=3154437 RepID=UPI0033301CBD
MSKANPFVSKANPCMLCNRPGANAHSGLCNSCFMGLRGAVAAPKPKSYSRGGIIGCRKCGATSFRADGKCGNCNSIPQVYVNGNQLPGVTGVKVSYPTPPRPKVSLIRKGPKEPRMFPGSLVGYRHFSLRQSEDKYVYANLNYDRDPDAPWRVFSPAQDFPPGWTDGENVARCERYEVNSESMKGTDAEIAYLESFIAKLEEAPRSSVEYYDITAFGDSSPRYMTQRVPNYELEEKKAELARQYRYKEEQVKYQEGKHRSIDCSCGFYVSYDPLVDFYQNQYNSWHICIHAVVECYGKIVLGTKGFRAQKMRILAMAPYAPRIAEVQNRTVPQVPQGGIMRASWCTCPLCRDLTATRERRYRIYEPDVPDAETMAAAVKAQMPGVRWYNNRDDMLKAHPEPSREGLTQHHVNDYGMGSF